METTQKRSLTSFGIKVIAIISMFIDHCGAVFLERKMIYYYRNVPNYESDPTFKLISNVDDVMRCIGRLAFPLFIFLLVQGFIHTRNRLKYAIRLALFALISEVPFDMAFKNTYFTMSYQNVFFTLFFGFLFLCTADFIYKKHIAPWLGYAGIIFSSLSIGFFISTLVNETSFSTNGTIPLKGFSFLISIAVIAAITVITEIIICRKKPFEELARLSLTLFALIVFMICAGSLKTDYNAAGVLAIALAYVFRESRFKSIIAIIIPLVLLCSWIEVIAIFDYLIVQRYNGEKGKSMKYFFYVFYPGHLLVIALIAKFLLGL